MKIITISGASGSGKSTLAEHMLSQSSGGLLLSLDRYYLSKEEQMEKNGFFNFDDPAALDTNLLKKHLKTIKNVGSADVPIYDFTVSQRAGYETVSASDLIIVDGLFTGAVLAEESDFSVFVDVDLDLALMRRIKRDIAERGRTLESVIDQYMNFVRPSYFKHIEHIKSTSDFVISNNSSNNQLIRDAEQIFELLNQAESADV